MAEIIKTIFSFFCNLPSMLIEFIISFLVSYIIVIPLWNLYAIRKLSFSVKQNKTWLKLLLLVIPVYFVINALWQSGVSGKFVFGQDFQNLPNYLAFFATVFTAYLLYRTFNIQRKANQQQKTDLQVERFESKFYNLIEIHHNNVNEVTIGKSLRGRKAFISMFNELKFTYWLVKNYYEKPYKHTDGHVAISEDIIYNIAYIIFFFGVGPNSSPIVIDLIGKKNEGFFLCVEEYITGYQNLWKSRRKNNQKIAVDRPTQIPFELDIAYMPCNGHMSKLSHYVRHLFQLVKFVDDADSKVFSYDEKYNYVSTIRSQLSTHEQLLLFYNAVSVLGKPWLDSPAYIKKYCVVKSLPLPLADFYKNPLIVLGNANKKGRTMFEWGEIKQRLNL